MKSVLQFLALLLFFSLCGLALLSLTFSGHAGLAAPAAILGSLLWLVWGPRPMPGLLPGLLMMTVLFNNLVVLGLLLFRLFVPVLPE